MPEDAGKYVRLIDPNNFQPGRNWATHQMTWPEVTSCRMYMAKVPVGGGGPNLHVHPFDQFYYVVYGTMQLEIGLQRYSAGPNCVVVLPAGVPHRNWNEGPGEEMHIALLVPPPGEGVIADRVVTIGEPVA